MLKLTHTVEGHALTLEPGPPRAAFGEAAHGKQNATPDP